MLGDLKDGDIIEVDDKNEAPGSASRELAAHQAVYRETKAAAIIHAHPPNAIAISLTDNKIIPQDAEGLSLYKSAAIIRTHQSVGSDEVARLLPSFLQNSSVVAMVKGHGSFALGRDLEEAYKFTSALESSCRVLVAVRSTSGARPPVQKERTERRSAIPPGIGVMDRSRYHKR
jgi:L-fuculose-phosphate aldolase